MKRTFLYLFSAFMLGISLSSCLDDTGARTSGSNYAMIHEGDDTTPMFAWVVGNLPLSWSGISSEYKPGDLIYLTYDIDLNNQNGGVISTDKSSVQVTRSYPIQDQKRITVGENVADTSLVNNQNQFEALSMNLQYPYPLVFKDRWIFTAKVKLKDGQIIDPQFSYDTRPEMQYLANGSKLENEIIIDVKLNIRNEGDGTATSQERIFVVDFSNVRSKIFDSSTENEKEYKIWLRYYDSGKNKEKPTYLPAGSLMHASSSTN